MQTFITSLNFQIAASQLDRQRLGKQRVECYQILKAISSPAYGWQNHPVVKMWRNHEMYLIDYACYVCEEWVKRGYQDTCQEKILDLLGHNAKWLEKEIKPSWLTEGFCSNHRSILLGKALWKFRELSDKLSEFRSVNREYEKFENKMWQAAEVYNWYKDFGWSEKPANRIVYKNRMIWQGI